MRSIYDLMQPSIIQDSEYKLPFPDVCTKAFSEFVFDEAPYSYMLTHNDIYRPDLMIAQFYTISELDDIVLTVNQIAELDETMVGNTVLIPTKNNVERFYNENYV